MMPDIFEENSHIIDSTGNLYKLYALFGIFLIIIPIMGMSYFIFFIHGLINSAALSSKSIEFRQSLVEMHIHDIAKKTEILNYLVERHLLKNKAEERSKLESIRSPAEHIKKKRAYSEKKNKRLNDIQRRLKNIKKLRYKSTAKLKESDKKLIANKYLIEKAGRYFDSLIWLSTFSLLVICLGSLMTKVGFNKLNKVK